MSGAAAGDGVQAAVERLDLRLIVGLHLRADLDPELVTHMVDPYALVVKAGVWHLVAAAQGALRVYPLAMLSEARLCRTSLRRLRRCMAGDVKPGRTASVESSRRVIRRSFVG